MNVQANAIVDKKTSKSSTAPYNNADLSDLLDILKEIQALMKGMILSSVPKVALSLSVFRKMSRRLAHKM